MTLKEQLSKALVREKKYLVDAGKFLKPKGRGLIREAILKWQRQGISFFIVTLPRNSNLKDYLDLAANLPGSRPKILILFNTKKWGSFGQGISQTLLKQARLQSRSQLKVNFTAGLISLMDNTGRALLKPSTPVNRQSPQVNRKSNARPSSAPAKDSSWLYWGTGFSLVGIILGAVYLVIKRRQRNFDLQTTLTKEMEAIGGVLIQAKEKLDHLEGLSNRYELLYFEYQELMSSLDQLNQAHQFDPALELSVQNVKSNAMDFNNRVGQEKEKVLGLTQK